MATLAVLKPRGHTSRVRAARPHMLVCTPTLGGTEALLLRDLVVQGGNQCAGCVVTSAARTTVARANGVFGRLLAALAPHHAAVTCWCKLVGVVPSHGSAKETLDDPGPRRVLVWRACSATNGIFGGHVVFHARSGVSESSRHETNTRAIGRGPGQRPGVATTATVTGRRGQRYRQLQQLRRASGQG